MSDNTIVLWTWKRMMEKTTPILIFKGYWAMGSMYLFMFYPDCTRVGQMEFCMN